MTAIGQDSLGTRETLTVGGKSYSYYSLEKAAAKLGDVSRLPFSMKVLLENMLRFEDGVTVTPEDAQAIVDWQKNPNAPEREIQYRPARVLMQDFTGVPCVVDLAAMRDAITKLGGDAAKINPQVPVHLVIDHSVMVDYSATADAAQKGAKDVRDKGEQLMLQRKLNEVAEQLGWRFPDHLVSPVAGGTLLPRILRGFEEFKELGLVSGELPKIHAAQPAGSSPVLNAIEAGLDFPEPVRPQTIAKSLAIGNPADGFQVIASLKRTGGSGVAATDPEILDAIEQHPILIQRPIVAGPKGVVMCRPSP